MMVQKVACANGKGININIKNETQIHSKIYEKSMQISCSKKGYPKHGNSSKKLSKKEMQNEKELEDKTLGKYKKRGSRAKCGTLPQGPGSTIRSKL